MAVFENHFEAGSICNQIQGDQINHYAIDNAYFDQQHTSSEMCATKVAETESAEIHLFRYISPFVTDEKERVHLHKVIVNLVTSGYGMSYICSELIKLDKADKLGLNTTIENQYNELVRLGLPKDEKGYSLRNYENYMSAAKEK